MTRRLEEAFEKASELPEDEQDDFAAFLLKELQAERRWSQTFERSQDKLVRLAQEALDEHRSGTSEKLNTDRLRSRAQVPDFGMRTSIFPKR